MKKTATWAFGFATFLVLGATMLAMYGALAEDEFGRQHPLTIFLHAITLGSLLYPGNAAVKAFVIPALSPSSPFGGLIAFLVFWIVNWIWLFVLGLTSLYCGRRVFERRVRQSNRPMPSVDK